VEHTTLFSLEDIDNAIVSKTLIEVYDSLKKKGYNPTNQLIGYILTNDESYITSYNNARNKIKELSREKIIGVVLKDYMKNNIWNI